ncbi:MAG: hypothetical protein IKB13_05605 [Clostridia bacterium]|nr:hypothetical protein [Clostridia bacterium]
MKTKTVKIFSAGFIAYLLAQAVSSAANTVYALSALVQYALAASVAPEHYTNTQGQLVTMLLSAVMFVLGAVVYTLLAVIVSSSLIEKLAPAKAKLQKIRFLPGILYMLQVLLFVASQIASVFLQAQEYLTDHLTLTVLNMLPTLLMRALIAVLVFTLPAVLLENDLTVFKTKTAPQTDDPAASAVSTDK